MKTLATLGNSLHAGASQLSSAPIYLISSHVHLSHLYSLSHNLKPQTCIAQRFQYHLNSSYNSNASSTLAVQCALAGTEEKIGHDSPSTPSLAKQRVLEAVCQIQLETSKDTKSRTKFLLIKASQLQDFPESQRLKENRVLGCTSRVWLTAKLSPSTSSSNPVVVFNGDSDSSLTKGALAVLLSIFSGLTPSQLLELSPNTDLNPLLEVLGSTLQQPSRTNALLSIVQSMQKKARFLLSPSTSLNPFPSLLITSQSTLLPQGAFAQAQASFLNPDPSTVASLASLLSQKKIGVVAHFYMDPEVQGVLSALSKESWPHIAISDSLAMADAALSMAAAGCEGIAVLGVDFMAENVRAILDRGGFSHVPVVRMSEGEIGCSLAEAASGPGYLSYLREASSVPVSLHVVYINTSLESKAHAQALLPTITCTSSNVVTTVLQAFAQVPELTLWYGPDTYMGGNLVELLRQLAAMSDNDISKVHPAHTQATVRSLLPRLRYFQDGTCMVHDMFAGDVVDKVRQLYSDAYQTAHFEVPGEMFALAMEARRRGKGTVGSTQNILDFISQKTKEAIARGFDDRLQFVLGTESGMVTAIVQVVKSLLSKAREDGSAAEIEVEIVFPVDSSAIAKTEESSFTSLGDLKILPGVQSGEGCSISGGCASCPYMKMNTLNALMKICNLFGTPGESLLGGYGPRVFSQELNGRTVADIGCEPIVHMRHFQKNGSLSDELVHDILTRNSKRV